MLQSMITACCCFQSPVTFDQTCGTRCEVDSCMSLVSSIPCEAHQCSVCAQGAHGESGMVPEARQDSTGHLASLEAGYPVPRRVVPVGAAHQGSPSGQSSSRHSPSVQSSRRPQDRKPVIETRSFTDFHIQRQVHPCKHMHLACLHDAQWGAMFKTHVDTSELCQHVSTALC